MAFLAKLFGKKKDNTPAEEALVGEEGLTPEEPLDEDLVSAAAAEAAEDALLNGEEPADEGIVVQEPDEEEITEEAIIKAMTKQERAKPEMLNASRKKRIAAGSGTTVEEVNRLLKQFDQIRSLMKSFSNPAKLARFGKGRMKLPF